MLRPKLKDCVLRNLFRCQNPDAMKAQHDNLKKQTQFLKHKLIPSKVEGKTDSRPKFAKQSQLKGEVIKYKTIHYNDLWMFTAFRKIVEKTKPILNPAQNFTNVKIFLFFS